MLSIKRIFIHPEHGGKDPGAVNGSIKESNLNLITALHLRDVLTACGFIVKLSRETDIYLTLNDVCNMSDAWGADLFLQVSHNAGGGDGYEVIHSIFYGKGQQLAPYIAAEFQNIGQNPHGSYGVRSRKSDVTGKDYYMVIRETIATAIITEFGFIDTADVQLFDTVPELHAEAEATAKGICACAGVQYKYGQPTINIPLVIKEEPIPAPKIEEPKVEVVKEEPKKPEVKIPETIPVSPFSLEALKKRWNNSLFLAAFFGAIYKGLIANGLNVPWEQYQLWVDILIYVVWGFAVYGDTSTPGIRDWVTKITK